MIEHEIYRLVELAKKGLEDKLSEGKVKGELNDTDYLTIYDGLIRLGYSRDEIFKCLIDIFKIDSISFSSLNEMKKNSLKILFSSLIELQKDDYSLINDCLKVLIKAGEVDPGHLIQNIEDIFSLSLRFNQNTFDHDTTIFLETKNHRQELAKTAKIYQDLCEGQYSLALSMLVFNIDILTGKKRTIKAIEVMSETDKLNIIKSFDNSLYDSVSQGYDSAIRNGAAHKSYEIKIWPTVIFTNTNRKGELKKVELTIESLGAKINKLFSVSQSIFTAETLKEINPAFDELISKIDYSTMLNGIDINELLKKYSG